jgi:ABC-type polysaccharide/polyol phosphate export permease
MTSAFRSPPGSGSAILHPGADVENPRPVARALTSYRPYVANALHHTRAFERAGQALLDAWAWRQLIVRLARAELLREHARLAFGSLWWILDALLYLGVYTLLVTVVLDRGGPDYPLYIFAPLLAWKWFTLTVAASCNAVVGNERIVKQLAFPRVALPLARVLVQAWRYLGGVVVLLLGIAFFWADRFTPALLWLGPLILAQLVLMVPVAVAASAITVSFRDTATLARHVMRVGLFLSPVLYSLDQALQRLPEGVAAWYRANPIAVLMEGYRVVTFEAAAPSANSMLLPIGSGLILAVPAFMLFTMLEPKFTKRL